MSRKIRFISELNADKTEIAFNETSLENTISRFLGFLGANGINDLLIKTTAKDVLDGKWTSTMPSIIEQISIGPSSIYNTTNTMNSSLDYNHNTIMALSTEDIKKISSCLKNV